MNELRAQGLSWSFADRPLFRGVDVHLRAGRVTALIGPNGVGKSTLLRLLLGQWKSDTGTVLLNGRPHSALTPRERARLIAYMPQQDEVSGAWTTRELVLMARYAHQGWWPFATAQDQQAADAALARVELNAFATRPALTLSGGERQRLAIARALARDAAILLLDEPASALDLQHQLATFSLLRSLADEGRAILVVAHDLNLPGDFADEVLVLANGGIAAAGPPAQVLRAEVLAPVYGVALHEARTPCRALPVLMPAAAPRVPEAR